MMEVILHPTPRWRDVVLEQVRVVGLSFRREALAVAVALGILTLMIGIDIVHGRGATWFDSDNDWFGVVLGSFFFPFAVWRRERRFGPAFLWTLPVDRRRLALAKAFAGWVWLMAALISYGVWQLALAALSGVTDTRIVPLAAFTTASVMYLFGSALVLGLRHPLRWLLGTFGVFFVLGMLGDALRFGPYDLNAFLISRGFLSAAQDAATQWTITTLLGLGAGLAVLWAAISRHRENR
ncbi:MAG TPA: hypothetical protein VF789_34655 [Thermoanaerobaculia bacterium]